MKTKDIVCVLPDESYLKANGAAFWHAKVEQDDAVEKASLSYSVPSADEFGRRLNRAGNDDELKITWLGAADAKGVISKKNVQSSWTWACKNSKGRKKKKQDLIEDGRGCCDAPEKEINYITHGAILVYNVKLTKGGNRLTQVSNMQIMEALHSQSKFVFNKLPPQWKESFHAEQGPKRRSRARGRVA
eukprot:1196670-Pleurochrysis_carterae.AAC.1